jgi:Na+/proline symporter
LAAQFLALGYVIEIAVGIDSLLLAMSLGAVVVLFYSLAGGMLASVYTDVLQGGLMAGVGVAVFYEALSVSGGLPNALDAIARSNAFAQSFQDPLGSMPAVTAFGTFFVFSVGVLGQPHMLHKFYMIDEVEKLRFFPVVVGAVQSLCLLLWLGIGLAVPSLVAQGTLEPLTAPDRATPVFLTMFASPMVAGFAFAAVLAAVMSTADSFLNIAAAAVVRDLPKAFGAVSSEPALAHELIRGRIAVALVAAVALAIGYSYGNLVALLGTFAFGTFAAALTPCLAIGFHWSGVTARAAIASIATGLLTTIGLELWAESHATEILPAAVGLAASFTVLLAVSWIDS